MQPIRRKFRSLTMICSAVLMTCSLTSCGTKTILQQPGTAGALRNGLKKGQKFDGKVIVPDKDKKLVPAEVMEIPPGALFEIPPRYIELEKKNP